jgi:hypothetical protein
MRVVVTGDRAFAKASLLNAVMDRVSDEWGITEIAHGGQKQWAPLTQQWRGVDYYVDEWAKGAGMPRQVFAVSDEEWKLLHRAAGPVRNRRMLDEFKPDRVLAFPGNKGTRDCIAAALERHIDTWGVKIIDGDATLTQISHPSLF